MKIPGAEEWAGYKRRFAAREAHAFWFGKSLDDAQPYFGVANPFSVASELLYMPRALFSSTSSLSRST